MKTSIWISISVAMLFLFSSCSPRLSPFTQQLSDENGWTSEDLKQIQFYLSDDIILRRQISSGSSEIISGEIKMVNGRKVDEVIIRKGTPGVALFSPKENRLAVSFEDGGDQRFLMFGPSKKRGDRYVVLASEWSRRQGSVTYDGKTYKTGSDSALASLLVDLKRVRKTSVRSHVAKGRKIN